MSKNPLVPTPIVNKNGVRTTVHKRVGLAPGSKVASLPLPTVETKKDNAAFYRVMKSLNVAYGTTDFSQYGVGDIDSLEYRLNKYQPEVINAYDQAIAKNPQGGFEDLLISALHKRVSSEKAGLILFIAQHDDEQEMDWDLNDQVSYNYERALEQYHGLKSLNGQFDFTVDDDVYGEEDPRSATIVSALIKVTNKLFDQGQVGITYVMEPGYGYTLNNDSAIELIARRPEDADRIAEIMMSRSNPDGAVIEEVLDAEVSALSDGII